MMDNYPNARPGCHAPRPPQLQFPGLPNSQVRSPNAHDGVNVGLLEPFQDPQLYGTDEQNPVAISYEDGDYGSPSSTNNSAEEPPRMPRIDYTQDYGPRRTPLLQTGEYPGFFGAAFQQQGNYTEAPSAVEPGDARQHIVPRRSLTTLSPEIGLNRVGHARRNSQHEPSGTGRRSSVGRRPLLQASNLEMTQIPLGSSPSAIQVSNSDWHGDPPEAVTTRDWDLSFVPFDWLIGNERNGPAEADRNLAMDPVFPESSTSRAHISHNVSEAWRNGHTSHHVVPQYPQVSPFHQTQGVQRDTRSPLSFAQVPSVMRYGMPSLDNPDFAPNPHEPRSGNTKTHLSPTWQPAHKVSSDSHYGERSNVSDNEARQPPRETTRGPKRKRRSDSSSPTTPPTGTRRRKRRFTLEERAEIKQKRKTGACPDCRAAKRKVFGELQMSLYRYHQAYCSYSARTRPLGVALP